MKYIERETWLEVKEVFPKFPESLLSFTQKLPTLSGEKKKCMPCQIFTF